ncbi:MAG: class I SAM-dependent methyltransferase [Planctomycetota bacterium]
MTHTLSLARYRLHQRLQAAIDEYATGRCLDAGSGRSPYRALLAHRGGSVVSIDIEDRSGPLDIQGDIQCMPQVASESFDTVLCSQVLEHVPRPWDAMAELARVLRPGGRVLLTVPHLSVIHEAPHDYFRYTRYGLAALARGAGLSHPVVRPTGGLLCFLMHGVSAAWMSIVACLPGMLWPAWAVNYLLLVRVAGVLDRMVGFRSIYPCDYLLVARKPSRAKGADP